MVASCHPGPSIGYPHRFLCLLVKRERPVIEPARRIRPAQPAFQIAQRLKRVGLPETGLFLLVERERPVIEPARRIRTAQLAFQVAQR